jgi:DNA-binding transcriptional MerR regulator
MSVEIPNRSVFRAQDVCELVGVQPYVLRTWEAEFPDLGVAKAANGPRLYRRGDVERVLRIKHLLFVDGLTIAGARRRLSEEGLTEPVPAPSDEDVAVLVNEDVRQQIRDVRRGLQWILGVLSGSGVTAEDFLLTAAPATANGAPVAGAAPRKTSGRAKPPRDARPVKKAARRR